MVYTNVYTYTNIRREIYAEAIQTNPEKVPQILLAIGYTDR